MIRITVRPGDAGWYADFQDGSVTKSAGPMRRSEAIALGEEAVLIWDAVLTILDDAA